MDQFNFSDYPETNFNEVNLSWMLETMSTFKEDLESGAFKGDQGDPGPAGPAGPQGDPADPAQVAAAVDTYLAENITQETGYVLDRSLTMENAAAPADLVGGLKSAIRYKHVWNAIEDGGCDPTNTTDCTSIIQSAISAADDGTIFYFPAGQYKISGAISITGKRDIRITGDGASWGYGTRFYMDYSYGALTFYGGSNIEIDGILFYTSKTTSSAITFGDNTPTTMDCRVGNVSVHDIKIQGFLNGIRVSCPTGYMFFKRVFINGMPSGGKGIIIGVNFSNTATTEQGYEIVPNNIHISECAVDDLTNGAGASAVEITVGQYIFIRDCDFCNFISSSGGYAVFISNNNSANKKLEDISLVGNSFYNNRVGVFIQSRDTSQTIHHLDISHNLITGRIAAGQGSEFGVIAQKTSGALNCKNATIIGNTFRNTNSGFVNLSADAIDSASICAIGVGVS